MTLSSRRPFRFAVQSAEATSAKEWLDTARRAEELGYSTLFTTDHYFGPGAIADATSHRPVDLAPIAAVMAAAVATTSLRVGCRVFCVDFHHPAVLAKELATIDLLSEGRLEVGLGAGWITAEYEGLGIPMDPAGVRIARLGEFVELIKAHFSGDTIDYRGDHVRVHGFAGRPLSVQQPHPPIFIGGGAPKILAVAGRLADIVSINFNNASGRLGADSVAGSTLDVTEQKIGWIREGAGRRFDDIELEIAAYFVAVNDDPTAAVAAMAERFGVTPEQLREHPHALFGSVSEICEKLQERRERLGISYVTLAVRNMEEFSPVVARLAGT
jgi:probable F420-dependent oxidoreductase